MSILIDEQTQIIVQAITGRQGNFHAARMIEYGTRIVGGVTPGKGGTRTLDLPVYDTVAEATARHRVDASIIFVPARFAAASILEAADAGIPLICCISEHVPVHDMIRVREYVRLRGSRLLGPNCPGVISPGKSKMGIMPNHLFRRGTTGIVSRSGTLTYEVAYALTVRGLGQSSVVGIGGDPINGTNFVEVLEMFRDDPDTESIIIIGEIGGYRGTGRRRLCPGASANTCLWLRGRTVGTGGQADGPCGRDCFRRHRNLGGGQDRHVPGARHSGRGSP